MGKQKRAKAERRSRERKQVAQQQQAGEDLMPGVWVDRAGGLHLSVPELLKHLGLPATPEGIEIATQHLEAALREQRPDATLTVQDDDTPEA